jgi:hypothetical protein
MNPFTGIFSTLLGGNPVEGISKLIEEFHLSPEQKAQIQQAAQNLVVQQAQIEAARDEALAALQSKNITAETQSPDHFVSRARPTFLYVMIAAIGYSLILAPLINVFLHKGLVPMEIPGDYLSLFGVGFLGYTGARTYEKTQGVGK